MKAVVAAFNQEKALVGAFSEITNLRMELFEALQPTHHHGHFLTDIIPLTSVLEIGPPGCGHLPELVEVLCLRPVPVHLRVQQVGLAVALAGAGVTSPEYKQL